MLFRFETAGDYKILVKGYKSAGGGQYRLTLRRFTPTDASLGTPVSGYAPSSGWKWIRFTAAAGQTVVLSQRTRQDVPVRVIAPTGLEVPLLNDVSSTGRPCYQTGQAGEYYAQFQFGASQSFSTVVTAAKVTPIQIGQQAKQHIEPGGLDLWTFDGKAGDVVRVEATSTTADLIASIALAPTTNTADSTANTDQGAPLSLLHQGEKNHGTIVAVLRRSGKFQVTVSQVFEVPVDYQVRLSPEAKAWDRDEVTGNLKLGGSDHWIFVGTKGQIVRLAGFADQFDMMLRLFDSNGDLVGQNDDGGGGLNPLMNVEIRENGKYIVEATCRSEAGSGSYKMTKTVNPVKALAQGAKGQGAVGDQGTEIWSLQGHAGELIAITARSSEMNPNLHVYGPDGVDIGSVADLGVDNVLSVKLPLDGTYTIWVTGNGGGHYSIKWIDL